MPAQVLVSPNWFAVVPVIVMPEIVRGAEPLFVIVTFCAALDALIAELKLSRGADMLIPGTPAPVPLRLTLCFPPGPLSAMLNDALMLPAAVGAKVTETLQLAPVPRLPEQVLVWLNWLAFAPVRATPDIVSGAEPLLLIVTFCAAADEPTFTEPKLKLVG